MLPPSDVNYLTEQGIEHSIVSEANMTCVLLPRFQLPEGMKPSESDLLLRLKAGYPDIAPDMWWFDPPVGREDGKIIRATNAREPYLGRSWQRWSRHLSAGQWRSGIDGLESFLALLRNELKRSSARDGQ